VLALLLLWAAVDTSAARQLGAARQAELKNDLSAAERAYERALGIRPDAETYQRLGLVRHMQNKFAEAIPAFEQAVQRNPNLWGAQLFLGIDRYRTNQFPKALDALLNAYKLQPRQADVHFWLGATRIALKQYLEGLPILEELSREQPRNLELLRLLAQSYSDYSAALHNRLVAEHPDSAWAFRVHGQALANEGYFEAALEEYQKARRLLPEMDGLEEAIAQTRRAAAAHSTSVQ
jgi:tetratricopeptide (TPR) repeat protein